MATILHAVIQVRLHNGRILYIYTYSMLQQLQKPIYITSWFITARMQTIDFPRETLTCHVGIECRLQNGMIGSDDLTPFYSSWLITTLYSSKLYSLTTSCVAYVVGIMQDCMDCSSIDLLNNVSMDIIDQKDHHHHNSNIRAAA